MSRLKIHYTATRVYRGAEPSYTPHGPDFTSQPADNMIPSTGMTSRYQSYGRYDPNNLQSHASRYQSAYGRLGYYPNNHQSHASDLIPPSNSSVSGNFSMEDCYGDEPYQQLLRLDPNLNIQQNQHPQPESYYVPNTSTSAIFPSNLNLNSYNDMAADGAEYPEAFTGTASGSSSSYLTMALENDGTIHHDSSFPNYYDAHNLNPQNYHM